MAQEATLPLPDSQLLTLRVVITLRLGDPAGFAPEMFPYHRTPARCWSRLADSARCLAFDGDADRYLSREVSPSTSFVCAEREIARAKAEGNESQT